jgi:anthranilate phosphoribosyltransferase
LAATAADAEEFSGFVATLGRGPGRSRSLTRAEARRALGMVLAGAVEDIQVGAFLMLLRYRGEDAEEIAGLVEAARTHAGLGAPANGPAIDLDWPSYGAGRTRSLPWFLLAALALARSGTRVLMHGSNEFSSATSVAAALAALGLAPAASRDEALAALAAQRFAYLPLAAISPALERLLGMRRLLGLRSPINTVARLLDPMDARAGIDGVFHPPYIAVHLGTAAQLGRPALLVLKGGGGEAERNPLKPVTAFLQHAAEPAREIALPALTGPDGAADTPPDLHHFRAVWEGKTEDPLGSATAIASLALGLLALGAADNAEAADRMAAEIWQRRL